jgi:hypothetical protein
MAKITAYVPEPTQNYDVNNQRQILEAINTIKDQLNFGYQQDLINQQNAMTQFIYGTQSGSFCPQQPIEISGATGSTAYDAFGRLRISQPYTLFDSQNRYAADNQFDTSTVTGGSTTYLPNESSVRMDVTTASGAEVVRQTFRSFPYQPGKGLLVLATFVMNEAKTNLRQRVGYFGVQNGVFFQLNDSTKSFILRTYIGGSVDDTTRKVDQSAWNGDKLDGTGASGLTLDLTKPQILWMDFEWLGVGNVRCGFIINGQYIVCHTYQNANVTGTSVYMTTAILPVRYEITNTAATADASYLKQICSTVISEGGYEQTSIEHIASMTSATAGSYITTTYKPLISIRLASTALGAVVIPYNINFLPTTTDNYQIGLFKNGTLTSASYSAVSSDANVEFDIAATAITGGTLVYSEFLTSRSGRSALSGASASFNFDLQLGASLAGASDVYSLCVRTLTGTGGGIGLLTFYDLTQ